VDGIDIHPPALRDAADAIDDATKSALDNVRYSLAPSASAVQGNPGWKSSAALRECKQAWETHLDDLVRRTSDAVDNLRASATDYEELEQRITDSLEALHWESE
jgi:uncharacterized protein YukE